MRLALLLASSLLLRVCGREEIPATNAAPTSVPAPPQAEHGGALASAQGLHVEVAALPDGRIAAYLRDPQARPVERASVQLGLRRPDGTTAVVSAVWDPSVRAYVGPVTEVPAGAYPVRVQATPAGGAAVQVVTPPVTITRTLTAPRPTHGGRVQLVNNAAVEYVTTPTGEVTVYWINPDGSPLPPAEVSMPSVNVTVDGRARPVALRAEGDHFVGRVEGELAPGARLELEVPTVTVRGVVYTELEAPELVVAAAAPTVVVRGAARAPAGTTVMLIDEDEERHRRGIEPPAIELDVPAPSFGVGFEVGVGVGSGGGGRPRRSRGRH